MTPGDRDALDALRRRLEHVSATAELLSLHGGLDKLMAVALDGIAERLESMVDQLRAITAPTTA